MAEERTLAYIQKNGDLIFDPDFFSKCPHAIKRMDNELLRNEQSGWVPKGCGNRKFIFKHEAGHRVWWWILENNPQLGVMISNVLLRAAKIGDLAEFCKHAVSAGNLSEAFCDVYAAIYCMDPDDQPAFVKVIHQFLKQCKIPVKD